MCTLLRWFLVTLALCSVSCHYAFISTQLSLRIMLYSWTIELNCCCKHFVLEQFSFYVEINIYIYIWYIVIENVQDMTIIVIAIISWCFACTILLQCTTQCYLFNTEIFTDVLDSPTTYPFKLQKMLVNCYLLHFTQTKRCHTKSLLLKQCQTNQIWQPSLFFGTLLYCIYSLYGASLFYDIILQNNCGVVYKAHHK